MVDAWMRVMILRPGEWEDWEETERKKARNPELACPWGLGYYGMIKEIQVGNRVLCQGYQKSPRDIGDPFSEHCLHCNKYVGRQKRCLAELSQA